MRKIILLAIVAIFSMTSCSTYNNMVAQDEAVKTAWSNVETQYQRRADLIPNLVATVKGYAEHESSTLQGVTEARTKATSVQLNVEDLTEENLKAYQQAQGEVSSALGRLIAVAENYPDLKANENFRDLQVQLEGTENRISVSRKEFNNAVQTYNVAVRRFPANILASIFGFDRKAAFSADEGAEKAPTVEF
jgi:LemA protein